MNSEIPEIRQIRGTTTILRPIHLAVHRDLWAAVDESHQQLERFMPFERTPEAALDFMEVAKAHYEAGRELHLAIYRRDTAKLCGAIGLNRFDAFSPRAHVGYWIRTTETGKGFATDALSALVDAAANKLNIERLDAEVAVDNIASERVLRNAGFVYEGEKKHALLCHGVWLDLKLFGQVLIAE